MKRAHLQIFVLTLLLVLGQAAIAPRITVSAPSAPQPSPPSILQPPESETSAELTAADRLFQAGLDQFNQQQFDAAIATWQKALAAYQALVPTPSSDSADETLLKAIAATQQNLLAAYLQENRTDDAIALFPQQAQLQQQLGKPAAAATADYTLAKLYAQQGRYREAIPPYERSLAYAQANDSARLPIVLGNLAIAYRTTGQYLKALETNQIAIDQLQDQENLPLLRHVLGNQGNVYQSLGDYGQAQSSFEAGLEIAEKLGDRPGQALLWNSLGGVAALQGDEEAATLAFRKSIEIATTGDTHNAANQGSVGRAWLNLGDVSHRQGQLPEAIARYEKSLAIAEALGDRKLQAEALGSLGVAHDSQEEFETAIDFLQRSLESFRQMGDRPSEGLTLNNLGHALYGAGQLEQSEATLRNVLEVLDDLRQGLSDLDKVSLFDTQAKTYLLLQQVLVAQGRSEAALEIAEWGRGRAFADLLAQRGAVRQSNSHSTTGATVGASAAAIAQAAQPPQLGQLRQVARSQQATLVEYSLVPQDDFVHQGKQLGIPEAIYIWVIQPDGTVHHRQADLRSLMAENQSLDQLVQQARCFAPAPVCRRRFRAAGQRPTRGLTQGLEADHRFDADRPQADLQRSGDNSSDNGSGDSSLADVSATMSPVSNRRSFPALKQLHSLLIDPIADLLPKEISDRVLIVPQGSLFLVPFAALQDSDGGFLIEKHTLLSAPSIQTLMLTAQTQPPKTQGSSTGRGLGNGTESDMVIVGNPVMPEVALSPNRPPKALAPLPGSEIEAKAIAQTLGTQPLIGAQAHEAAVVERLPQARWIHLATHGLFDYGVQTRQQQIPGALALATDPSGEDSLASLEIDSLKTGGLRTDGLLTADEILDLDLQAELVVLSACDTGRGNLTGDGVVGLSRAWMGAGVPSLVVSLWAVSDESTAQLMQQFYQELDQGYDKATALRKAMLTTAQDYPNPHDWAAFSLVGMAQ